MSEEIRLEESLVTQPAKLRHDSSKGIVYGVKLVSFGESLQKRTYDKSCAKDVNKYHGAKVNINHQKNPESAPFESRFGKIFNPKVGTDGIYGDMKYNPEHQFAKQFAWWVDNDPEAIGLSHNVMAHATKLKDGKLVVTGFKKVDSVDLVADPTSNKNLFESKMPFEEDDKTQEPASPKDEPMEPSEEYAPEDEEPTLFDEALAKLAEAAVLEAAKLDCAECARKVRAIADLLDDMEGGEDYQEEDGSEESEESTPEEEPMKESKDLNQNESQMRQEIDALKAELAEIRLRESKALEFSKRKVAMRQKCVDAKLSDRAISDLFIESLASQDSDEIVQRMIEDRSELLTSKVHEDAISSTKTFKPLDLEAAKALLGVK